MSAAAWLRLVPKPADFLALLVIAAFVLCMGTVAYVPIPEANQQQFAGLVGALQLLVGGVAGYYWPRRGSGEREGGER